LLEGGARLWASPRGVEATKLATRGCLVDRPLIVNLQVTLEPNDLHVLDVPHSGT
jgi:hypothetical protein